MVTEALRRGHRLPDLEQPVARQVGAPGESNEAPGESAAGEYEAWLLILIMIQLTQLTEQQTAIPPVEDILRNHEREGWFHGFRSDLFQSCESHEVVKLVWLFRVVEVEFVAHGPSACSIWLLVFSPFWLFAEGKRKEGWEISLLFGHHRAIP